MSKLIIKERNFMGDEQEPTPAVSEQADTATPEVPTDSATGETPGSSESAGSSEQSAS